MSAAESIQPIRARVARVTDRGWRPFPCKYGDKRPAVGIHWPTATASAQSAKTLDLWFGRDLVNIGIACRGSNLVILDEDELGGMERLCAAYGQPVPVTYRVRTAKGWHWYFDAPDWCEIGNSPGPLEDFGFDVRGTKGGAEKAGGYVIGPGSLHASGHVYEAEDDDADTVELPVWIAELLLTEREDDNGDRIEDSRPPTSTDRRFTERQARDYIERYAAGPLREAREGRRNKALNDAALLIGHFVPALFAESVARRRLMEMGRDIGLDDTEIGPTVRSGLRAGMREPYTITADFSDGDQEGGDEDDAETDDVLSSWIPCDLDELWDDASARKRPSILARTDGPSMFYAGETHSVHGESESGKSWVAQIAVVQVLARGGRVLYLDYESDERSILLRLRALGLEREWLKQFDYICPDGPRDAFFAALLESAYDLCVIDGVTAALAVEPDTKSNDGDAVTAWDKALPRRIARRTEAAVVMVDHVSKSKDTRGRFAIGSQAKMSNVSGSAFFVDVETVLRIGEVGVLRIYVGKDRPSGVREHAGPMRQDRLQPFARLIFDGRESDIITELVPWVGKDDDAEPDLTGDAHMGPLWWERPEEDLPEAAQKLAGTGAETARDMWRWLDRIADPDGRTITQVWQVLNERRRAAGQKPVSRTNLYAAVALLKNAGLVGPGDRLSLVSSL